ncbi:MAG: gamma-glutamyltranspeptidase [Actinobacteria bacterium]|nr:MAG: gamma-glutamyltranspeptidase [Actinomycetota bacterium]
MTCKLPAVIDAGLAAGHPATTAAGIDILAAGGSAADAAVAAALASCVAETVMTGLLGGGHGLYFDAASGRTCNLDCFVAVPGLDAEPREAELVQLEVPFGAELVHYAIGPASCGVPGLPAGLVALWEAHGRLPWPRLVEPALRLAESGVEFPPAHAACLAMLAPVMTMNEGAAIYSPGGRLLTAGERLEQPGLARALGALAEDPASFYRGTIGRQLLELCRERGGLVTQADLEGYEAVWSEPVRVPYLDVELLTRAGLSGIPETVPRLPRLAGLSEKDRVLALVDVLEAPSAGGGDTTNVSVVDGQGNVCVLTSSLGLGSGDFLPGLDLHLNSMLGESDLLRGRLEPGTRMGSMMAPTLALDGDGPVLAAGAAGGTRLRTALLGVVASIVDEGLSPTAAVARPRFHPALELVNAEPGVDENALAALEEAGRTVRRWPAQHHYFGGVSLVSRGGPAADPRRNGAAARLR